MDCNKKDIENFFRGRLSQKEAEEFMNWINSSEGEKDYESIVEQLWNKEDRENSSGYKIEPKVNDLKSLSISDTRAIDQRIKADQIGRASGRERG